MYKKMINRISLLKSNITNSTRLSYNKIEYKKQLINSCKDLVEDELFKDEIIMEDVVDFYQMVIDMPIGKIEEIINSTDISNKLDSFIKEMSLKCYGQLNIDYESYNIKTILYYENDQRGFDIAYMAGSFYTDQEYRTFLASIQKGRKRNNFTPVDTSNYANRLYDLNTIKDGYLSRVKRTINGNTQDGYHADFHLNNGRFFLLRENDNPIDVIYKWIIKNTQAAVLEEWKTYLYNTLHQKGHIIDCKSVNYTGVEISGIILSEAVNTELIREIRKEGMGIGEISIPREPVELDENMSFIDAMTKYIIPEITNRKTLYTVGDELSPIIDSPIIFKTGNTLKKTYLFPKQKVMAQGMLNGIKAGRNNQIFNGGMGIGKTYTSIKVAYATIREHFNKDSGRVAVFCQSHIILKWERQFREALPDVPLKFIKLNGFKDVIDLEDKEPEGIEVYLLPKDKIKRKYLEGHSATRKYSTSLAFKTFYENCLEEISSNIFIADTIKPSEMRLMSRRLSTHFEKWTCVAKSVFNEDGDIVGYKVATTSSYLKKINGKATSYYDFYVNSFDDILKHKKHLDENEVGYYSKYHQRGLVCPCCGGPIYEKEDDQLSEDDYKNNMYFQPDVKTDRNKKCTNYIKVDNTPLTSLERKLLIKGELDFVIDNDSKTPYIDSDDAPIKEYETLQLIKQGRYEERYTIVVKRCDTSLWTALDKKGYRTVNTLDMIERKFGKGYFSVSISDESHLYSAASNQGESFSKLCKLSKVNLALTGTLTGGKASHLFYTLYRMFPQKMSRHFKYSEMTKFIDYYGRRKKVTKESTGNESYNKSGVGRTVSTSWSEIPGISPLLYSHFLADVIVSRKIEDMGFDLPPLKYFKHEVEMSKDIKRGYNKLKDDIVTFMKENKHLNLGGTYLNTLLSYPDMPISDPLYYGDMLISVPEKIDIENIILPKEQKLIDTLKKEIQLGRRMVVYITFTGKKEIDRRVEKVLKNEGFKVAVLKSSVNTEKREQWIDDRYKEGVQVIITNPKIVQTGLDIIGYPSMYFYQLDYDVRVVRQAESRAWRVGQKKDCYVYYSVYNDTIAVDALKLIGSKKKASLSIEGVFAEDLLSASGDDVIDSGVAALYKSLLGKIKLKEDDLDFFSEEEIIEIFEEPKEEKVITTNKQKVETQLSFFTATTESISILKKKDKKNTVVGQISLFQF